MAATDPRAVATQELGKHLLEARKGIQALKADMMEMGDKLSADLDDTNERLDTLQEKVAEVIDVLNDVVSYLTEQESSR
ncbi:MAG: hypothetical protein F4X17_01735 [Gemmatimonadetes bacterium]|nr:hypothetical protein [Gemmatimonadota bacterium]